VGDDDDGEAEGRGGSWEDLLQDSAATGAHVEGGGRSSIPNQRGRKARRPWRSGTRWTHYRRELMGGRNAAEGAGPTFTDLQRLIPRAGDACGTAHLGAVNPGRQASAAGADGATPGFESVHGSWADNHRESPMPPNALAPAFKVRCVLWAAKSEKKYTQDRRGGATRCASRVFPRRRRELPFTP